MSKESVKEQNARWKKENAKVILFRLYKNTDADLIQFFKGVDNTQGTIKRILRDYISRKEEEK